jgi:hypothetical protein
MKEYFIVKKAEGARFIFYAGSTTVHKNEHAIIDWENDVYRSYRHDTYADAQITIAAIANDGALYQIDKLFVKT